MVAHDDIQREAREEITRIAQETVGCERCPLHIGARRSAPGSGPAPCEIMLIGEAPSAYDDRSGRPFSGPSGVFLDELLGHAGLSRADVFLTNLVKHRVPPGAELLPDEVAACSTYLTRQITAVNPSLIVTLGRGALAWFLPKARITAMHGKARAHRGRVLLAMYNPAAALHREELRQTVIADFAHALPAALSEARRLSAEGRLGPLEAPRDEGPAAQQLSLF